MTDITFETIFQTDTVGQMQAHGWQVGNTSRYQAETALYVQDVPDFVQTTQPHEWQKFCCTFPIDSECHFITSLVKHLNKVYEHATDRASRIYSILSVLTHGLKVRNAHSISIRPLAEVTM